MFYKHDCRVRSSGGGGGGGMVGVKSKEQCCVNTKGGWGKRQASCVE